MKTKLNELLEFPTPFTYKVMGQALPELVDQVVEVVQRHAPGDYTPTVKPAAKASCPIRYLSLSTPLISSRLKHCMKNWAKSILSAHGSVTRFSVTRPLVGVPSLSSL